MAPPVTGIPDSLSVRVAPEATNETVASAIDPQIANLQERLRTTLLMQDQANADSLTSGPSPMVRGLSSAIVAALPYLAGRAAGGGDGGLVGANLGLKAADQYGANLELERKRKADIADLYLKRSTALDSQISQLSQAKESIQQRAEAATQADETRRFGIEQTAQIQKMGLQLREQMAAQTALTAQSLIASRAESLKLERERLELAKQQGADKKTEKEREAALAVGELGLGELGYSPLDIQIRKEGIKTVKAADEEIETLTGMRTLLEKVDSLESSVKTTGAFSGETSQALATLMFSLKKPDQENLGAALTDGEKALLARYIGLPERNQWADTFVSRAAGDKPAQLLTGLKAILARRAISSGVGKSYVPSLGGRNLLGYAVAGLDKEARDTYLDRVSQDYSKMRSAMVRSGEAKDKVDANRKIQLMLQGQKFEELE